VNHGFARTALWSIVGSSVADDGVALTVSLTDSPTSRAMWPHRFRVDLTVTVSEALTLELWIENTDDHPWECTYLLHNYFAVGNAATAGIVGLHGLEFIDKTRGGVSGFETREEVVTERFTDRIYRDAPETVELLDRAGGRRFVISRDNFRDVVVWNPGSERISSLADCAPDDYTRFVCVESGNVAAPVVIPTGERVVSIQTVRSEAGEG
jgi:glucose-6-phosphate 1-epimerase